MDKNKKLIKFEHLFRYIEEQLNKRKNSNLQNSGNGDNENESYDEKYLSPEEAALLSLPEHLRVSSTHRSEEMLSNQMLNGIPEVDLGIDVKIKNIEATEAAKEKLIRDQKNKKVNLVHSPQQKIDYFKKYVSVSVGTITFRAQQHGR